jgi:hypothetical protein
MVRWQDAGMMELRYISVDPETKAELKRQYGEVIAEYRALVAQLKAVTAPDDEPLLKKFMHDFTNTLNILSLLPMRPNIDTIERLERT